MNRSWKMRLACLAAAASAAFGVQSRPHAQSQERITPSSRARMPGVPLFFVPNQGQSDAAVLYQARALGGTAFFTASEMVLALPLHGSVGGSQPTSFPGDPRTANLGAERGVPVKFVRVRFVGASPALSVEGTTRLPALVHEFRQSKGSSPRANLPTYASVLYKNVYDGIDLEYAEDGGRLKATYTVAPGVDPSIVRWRYEGTAAPGVDAAGNLHVGMSLSTASANTSGELTELTPAAWQDVAGQRHPIDIRYAVAADGSVGFSLPNGYDRTQPLTLDPTLTYSTFLGGGGDDNAYDVAVDAAGFAYVVGRTLSVDFPTGGAIDPGCGTDNFCDGFGFYDAFVTKLNTSASGAASLVFSTYLGGSANDFGLRVRTRTVSGSLRVYVAGIARDSFPTTPDAYDRIYGGAPGADGFLSILSGDGSQLLYSTYLGGSNGDGAWGLDVDANGIAAIAGQTFSTDFPTVGAFDTTCGTDGTCNTDQSDAFVARINPAVAGAAGLVYSTYLGGSGSDQAYGVAYDSLGRLHVAGRTPSTDFPTSASARQPVNGGPGGTISGPCFAFEVQCDAFVSVVSPGGGAAGLAYSSYLGGSGYEDAYSVAVDGSGNTLVVGSTFSSDFPATANAFQPSFGGTNDAYLARFASGATGSASLPYATFLGGAGDDQGYGLALLGTAAHVAGFTNSTNFPSAGAPFQPANGGFWDAFALKLDSTIAGSAGLSYATYLGGLNTDATYGIGVAASGAMTVAGQSFSVNFPVVNAFQNLLVFSGSDAIVARIDTATTSADLSVTQTDTPDPVAAFNEITYTVTISNNGPNTATGVRLADVVSPGTSVQSFAASQGSCLQDFSTFDNDIACDLGTLGTGGSATVTIGVVPSSQGTVTSSARVSSNVSDPNAGNNADVESTDVVTPSLSIDNVSVVEGNTGTINAVFTVTLSPPSAQTVTVDYTTANGTATAGSDYTAVGNSLTFAPGETTQPISIAVTGDTVVEANETFFVNLDNASGANISDDSGQGTITNDDSLADLDITQVSGPASASPGGFITVSNTVRNAGGAPSGPFRVGLYFSDDNVCSTSDTLIGSRAVGSLAPGATSTANSGATIPAAASLGARFICAIADDLAAVPEASETNNSASTGINVVSAVPIVTLKINGQHPTPPTVPVTGPTLLTLDVSASTFTTAVDWYWAIIFNGQVLWVTSTGLSTVPGRLINAPPAAVSNATLLNIALPPATTMTNVLFMVNGTAAVAADIITATRP